MIGIDISEDQIINAIQRDNIEYRCHKGEDLSFLQSNSIDLITIATTLHWIDIELFIKEVKRVLKQHTGVFVIWTYAFGTLDNQKANIINREFYYEFLLSYWHEKQHLVEDYYQSLLSLFPYQSTLQQYTIQRQMETTLKSFIGFIETTSACQLYRKENNEEIYQNTLKKLREKFIQCYTETETNENNEQITNVDSIKIIISSPIRLYLMRKNEI